MFRVWGFGGSVIGRSYKRSVVKNSSSISRRGGNGNACANGACSGNGKGNSDHITLPKMAEERAGSPLSAEKMCSQGCIIR